jgi:hypothetical protein
MLSGSATRRYMALMLWLVLSVAAGAVRAGAIEIPFVKSRFIQVEVYDRDDGIVLPVYAKGGRNYIVGTPGHEYAVRIRNCTHGRVLVVTSVDGVNVISGDTAAPSQSGYVLDAWGSVEIAGWRKSLERTAAFYFTDLGDSYAARTGRPDNVGIVGFAVFQEKQDVIASRDFAGVAAAASEGSSALGESKPAPSASRRESAANGSAQPLTAAPSEKPLGKLGTGHGRSEESRVSTVSFERSTDDPVELLSIQYDRRENLAAMHVLPRPVYAQGGESDPFPAAIRFAPDPAR